MKTLAYRAASRASAGAFVLIALPHWPHLGLVWLGASLVAYRLGDPGSSKLVKKN